MPLHQWLLIAVSVSIDGFFIGAATALAGSRLKAKSIACIGACVFILSSLAACAGLALGRIATTVGALLLLGVGITYIAGNKKEAHNVGTMHSVALGLSVAADACAASIIIGGSGVSPAAIGAVMSAMHILSVSLGNSLPKKFSATRIVRVLGGCVLVGLAIFRLL